MIFPNREIVELVRKNYPAGGFAMKIDAEARIKICPRCGNAYHGAPALSWRDDGMMICPDCGTREALESIGVKPQEQDEILEAIHRSMRP